MSAAEVEHLEGHSVAMAQQHQGWAVCYDALVKSVADYQQVQQQWEKDMKPGGTSPDSPAPAQLLDTAGQLHELCQGMLRRVDEELELDDMSQFPYITYMDLGTAMVAACRARGAGSTPCSGTIEHWLLAYAFATRQGLCTEGSTWVFPKLSAAAVYGRELQSLQYEDEASLVRHIQQENQKKLLSRDKAKASISKWHEERRKQGAAGVSAGSSHSPAAAGDDGGDGGIVKRRLRCRPKKQAATAGSFGNDHPPAATAAAAAAATGTKRPRGRPRKQQATAGASVGNGHPPAAAAPAAAMLPKRPRGRPRKQQVV